MSPDFQQKLKRLENLIKRKIGDLITETHIDTFEVKMMPYEDVTFQEMKQSKPEALMQVQYDAPTTDEGDE